MTWSPTDLAILVPMLGRAHRVRPLVTSIDEATPGARILFLVSPHDLDVHKAIDEAGRERFTVPWPEHGQYARKINEGYRHTTEPLLFTGADDLHFYPGWFEVAVAHLDDAARVIGTNDQCNRRTRNGHSTHSLITRPYADLGTIDGSPGILHEGYPHEFVDDELIGTARHRGAYRHARKSIVAHLHPMNGGAPMDDLYAAQGARMAAGRALYQERSRLWT